MKKLIIAAVIAIFGLIWMLYMSAALSIKTQHTSTTDYYNNDVSEQISADWERKAEFISNKKQQDYRRSAMETEFKKPEYTVEILANCGGFRGLIINKGTGLVERRTKVHESKDLALSDVTDTAARFYHSSPSKTVRGLALIDGVYVLLKEYVRGL